MAKQTTAVAKVETAKVLAVIKPGAITKDLAISALKRIDQSEAEKDEANRLVSSYRAKDEAVMSEFTLAFVKAAKADTSIHLEDIFSTDRPTVNKLFAQLYQAIGAKEVVTIVTKAGKEKSDIDWTKPVRAMLPHEGMDAKETKRAESRRTSLSDKVKRSCKAAVPIAAKMVDARFDKKAGTLLISGPAVKKHFGQDNLLLDEREKTENAKGEMVPLSKRASFTQLANIGAIAHGKPPTDGSNTRGSGANVNNRIIQVGTSFVSLLNKLKAKPADNVTKAINSVANACGIALKLA